MIWGFLNEAKILQLLLVWSPGKGSHIHDHANAQYVCLFFLPKILGVKLLHQVFRAISRSQLPRSPYIPQSHTDISIAA
jgi:hypothetical protein